jgi:bla regulator protein blaR1
MMKKKTENKYAFVKQLVVLPLLAVLVMGLSNREVKTEVIQKENQLESNQLKNDSLKMNNKEFMSQLYHDGLFELQDYGEGAPLIFLNGKEVIEKVIFDESDFKTSQILPPKEAVERFGERGKNGAMIFETKTNYLQKEAIKGKVTNEKGEPLVGASVIIKGNTIGTITDTKGNYEIRSERKIETLVFGKNGYETMEIKVGEKSEIDVKLIVDKRQTQ